MNVPTTFEELWKLTSDLDTITKAETLRSYLSRWEFSNPRAKAIARRQQKAKAALAALRDERKQATRMWDAVRAGSIYRELTSNDKLEYRRRKGVHVARLKEIRERERLLLDKMKSIKSEWHAHYDDIRKKREAIEKALDGATEAGFRNDNLSHFFEQPDL